MKKNLLLVALAAMMLPAGALAQSEAKKDTTDAGNSKEVKNRNVMLNASSADQPRQISIGLPSSLGTTIFTDGLPESYTVWPDMPYFSWFGGTSIGRISVMNISETALQYGAVGYTVDSKNKMSSPQFGGAISYGLNNYGRQSLGGTITGPIKNGWGYTASSYQVWDPGTYSLQAANLQNRTQQYKFGVDKSFDQGRGKVGLLYSYSRYTSTSSSYAPFIFVGDGSVKEYNGFKMGNDAYYSNQGSAFTYLDIHDGKIKSTSWKDAGTTTNHQLTFTLDYLLKNNMKLNVSSKLRLGDVSMAMIATSGVVKNNGKYFYQDGSSYKGDYVQNRWLMYVPGYERSWLTSAVLTGTSRNKQHNWRVGVNAWFNRAQVTQMNTVLSHEVKNDPEALYVRDASTGLLSAVSAYNPGSGEYYKGHENKLALYASDDWTLSSKLWMSAGVRLEYQGLGGHGYLNPTAEDTYNTRTMGWTAVNGKAKLTPFKGDWLNPALTYNVRYSILRGFGLVGEYVYVRQRPNLQDFAGATMPVTKPVNINMGRAGLYWNTPWMQLVSQVSFISQTNYKSRSTFYHVLQRDAAGLPAGSEVSVTQPINYDVQTLGWTTDVVLNPFKGFSFHGLLTLQNPVYKRFKVFADFPDGMKDGADVSNNYVTAMSRCQIELDPSYAWNNWRVWLSFRYFSRQYINKTNSLYFNGWWESFGGVSYKLNKNINFALNVVNIFNQTGATGSIGAADLVTNTEKYKDFVMAGSYIRPFEVNITTNISF